MKTSFLILTLSASMIFAADTATPVPNLNEQYVNGLKLIAETQSALSNADDVLTLVEASADAQADRIAQMEGTLQSIANVAASLDGQSQRRTVTTMDLSLEKDRLQARFATLSMALADDRSLLAGATKTVQDLILVADKSGKVAERRLADQATTSLKEAAEQLQSAQNRLTQMQLRVEMETTLLQGLQPNLARTAAEVGALKTEHEKAQRQVKDQRAAIDRLNALLKEGRTLLTERRDKFGKAIESFRLAQVRVLRHWLLEGPPESELPPLTIDDVILAGLGSDEMAMSPNLSSTVLGPNSGGFASHASRAGGNPGAIDPSDVAEAESAQVSGEAIRLNKQAQWYLAMLRRLTSFAAQSNNEAISWTLKMVYWRNEFSSASRTQGEQLGTLTSLQVEQGMLATTIELFTKQAMTARAQVETAAAQVNEKITRLNEISATLRQQAK